MFASFRLTLLIPSLSLPPTASPYLFEIAHPFTSPLSFLDPHPLLQSLVTLLLAALAFRSPPPAHPPYFHPDSLQLSAEPQSRRRRRRRRHCCRRPRGRASMDGVPVCPPPAPPRARPPRPRVQPSAGAPATPLGLSHGHMHAKMRETARLRARNGAASSAARLATGKAARSARGDVGRQAAGCRAGTLASPPPPPTHHPGWRRRCRLRRETRMRTD